MLAVDPRVQYPGSTFMSFGLKLDPMEGVIKGEHKRSNTQDTLRKKPSPAVWSIGVP